MTQILQIDPTSIMDSAKNVGTSDNGGYTHAIVVLSFMLTLCIYGIKRLWDENKDLNKEAKQDAKDTLAALTALNTTMKEWKDEDSKRHQEMRETVNNGAQRVLDNMKR